jgi:hypothetical protein
VRLPVYAETGFRVHERHDALTGVDYTFAVATEHWTSADPSPPDGIVDRLAHAIWIREGKRPTHVDQEAVESARDGWVRATHENLASLSHAWRYRLREEQKLRNLAKQRGIHLLTCVTCGELSDLDARGWRLVLDEGGAARAFCLRCER